MQYYLNLRPKSFSLDVSDNCLKGVKLKNARKSFSLSAFNELCLNPGIVEDGVIKDKEKFISALKSFYKGSGFFSRKVIVSLTEKKSFLTTIQMPKMKDEELRSAISFEVENHIPVAVEDVYWDFRKIEPIKDHLDHLDILLIAFPKEIIDSYIYCFKKANLEIQAIEVDSQAIVRAVVKDEFSLHPLVIINLRKNITNLIIFSGYSIRFVSCLNFYSQQLTETISKELNISVDEAERLKIRHGLDLILCGPKKTGENIKRDIFKTINPALNDLVAEIKQGINYFYEHSEHEHSNFNNNKVEKIILSGNGANLKGLSNFLSLCLNIPVELADPLVNVYKDVKRKNLKISEHELIGYTTAIGSALKGIKYPF